MRNYYKLSRALYTLAHIHSDPRVGDTGEREGRKRDEHHLLSGNIERSNDLATALSRRQGSSRTANGKQALLIRVAAVEWEPVAPIDLSTYKTDRQRGCISRIHTGVYAARTVKKFRAKSSPQSYSR